MSAPKPFSLGFNNHAASCDCFACATERAKALRRNQPVPGFVVVKGYARRQRGFGGSFSTTVELLRSKAA